MVDYHSNESIRELVSYIEEYHPEVLFVVRPEDTIENRRKGYRSGQPDILILEQRCSYTGLALWSRPKLTKTEIWFLRRLERVSYRTVVSDDCDDLRLEFMMYMAMCVRPDRMDSHQLQVIEHFNSSSLRPSRSPLTTRDYARLKYLIKYVRDAYPSAVLIPGLGVDDKPDLTIVSPDVVHNGLAIWISYTSECYRFNKLSDKQLDCLKMMADRSYVTVAGKCQHKLALIISDYMIGNYVGNISLPM